MQLAKDAGFDGIELNYDLENDLSPKSGTKEYTAIRKMAEKIGIEISGICSFLYWPYPLTSNLPAERERGVLARAGRWDLREQDRACREGVPGRERSACRRPGWVQHHEGPRRLARRRRATGLRRFAARCADVSSRSHLSKSRWKDPT